MSSLKRSNILKSAFSVSIDFLFNASFFDCITQPFNRLVVFSVHVSALLHCCAPCRALCFWLRRSKAELSGGGSTAADWTTADKKERQRQKESLIYTQSRGVVVTQLRLRKPLKNFTKSPVTHGKPTRQEIRG